ncbi:XdhC family protein [Occallatibacter savannae]|uniref:XdhC family protein n=1 Tax=Occallatibacter savannae TaxID=1002691 RepID=UPI000D69D8CB|nr:XdhC/CoxI family protein [Occallatibacter savannae]
MTDLENILPLWQELEAAGAEYVLATVVEVEGPSYRKPGARMLIAKDGRRAGTVSGGCLEAEVAKRAWWLTESGPVIGRYSTVADDGEMPYGSGCGGVVYVLLERRATADPLLRALEAAFHARAPLAIATILEGAAIGTRAFAGPTIARDSGIREAEEEVHSTLNGMALQALQGMQTVDQRVKAGDLTTRVWVDYRAARPGLWIYGAGDDAKPIVHLARQLGWFVAVADGRSHLATRNRFPTADSVLTLPIEQMPERRAPVLSELKSTDAAVLVTHSFEQDSRILASLLARETPPAYVGVLGPQRRTREVLAEAFRLLGREDGQEQIEKQLADLHAPTGLDIGAETPAVIALSIIAEIQQTLSNGSALPLRQVRAVQASVPSKA